jgi:prevent-host-death family protein
MLTVDIHAAKTQLAQLLSAAVGGEEVIIAEAGKPVARLVPIDPDPPKRRLGLLAGKLPLTRAFDEPLPDGTLTDFEGQ